jgi:hypothetical protein
MTGFVDRRGQVDAVAGVPQAAQHQCAQHLIVG